MSPSQQKEHETFTIEISETDQLTVGVTEFEGRQGLNIRRWWMDRKTGQWNPGKQGLWLPIAVVPEVGQQLIDAISEVIASLETA